MMLEWLGDETRPGGLLIREAVERVLRSEKNRTPDLGGALTTAQMGDLIAEEIRK